VPIADLEIKKQAGLLYTATYGRGLWSIKLEYPPIADFSASSTDLCLSNSEVSFTDETAFSPTSWNWDFGDGNSSNSQNPTHTYTNAGTYAVSLTVSNQFGTDTETKTNYITVSGVSPVNDVVTSCNSYTWFGQTYTTSGNYTHTVWQDGCTTNHTLYLTVIGGETVTSEQSACDSYTWFGQVYTTSGTYSQVVQGQNGCDITHSLQLTINQSTAQTINQTQTGGNFEWHGTTYYCSGVYTNTSTNASGCPHVESLNLSITNPSFDPTVVSACNSYIWDASGQEYAFSGNYSVQSTTPQGCLATNILNLTIGQNQASTQNVTLSAATYTWPVNNQIYSCSGIYTHVVDLANGCQHTYTLELDLN
jgi:PKD repeat protein